MSINFKHPKYILPLLALPFIMLFFYVYHSSAKKPAPTKAVAGINSNVGEVSDDVKKKELSDKLDAYRNTYKEADGFTAVSPIAVDKSVAATMPDDYSAHQKRVMDSIRQLYTDHAMVTALNKMKRPKPQEQASSSPTDPMQLFRQQIAYMDSMHKPAVPPKKKEIASVPVLSVRKAADTSADFNTVKPEQNSGLITAVIDENITGYAGSRIRLRLLEDILAGNTLIRKGTYLYALISGFSEQRVTLTVKSILYDGKILPVKLDLYDTDGLPGLYVPASAFRDFTKDASTSSIQGMDVESSSNTFLMSTADKLFESTSSAIAGIIRKDKAKLKYNSYLYLIESK